MIGISFFEVNWRFLILHLNKRGQIYLKISDYFLSSLKNPFAGENRKK